MTQKHKNLQRLKLDMTAGREASLERREDTADYTYTTPGTLRIVATANGVEFATPRAKLIEEADRAIRADLIDFPKALAAYEALSHDSEAIANWDMANYITVRKLGYNDHGRVHSWVTGAASLAILELLLENGVRGDVLESGTGDVDDTYLVVLIGTMLHDIGNQVHRQAHESFGVVLAMPILERLLTPIYSDVALRTKIRGFILHSINCHDLNPAPLTLEGGITAVADGTDITKGRGRKAFALGKVDIHSVGALAVDQVVISRGTDKPIEINVSMNNSAGIFQVEETLAKKVINSPIAKYINLTAATENSSLDDHRIVHQVRLEGKGFVKLEP